MEDKTNEGMVKDLKDIPEEEKDAAWVNYVRKGLNDLLDIYLPVAESANMGVRYTPHVIERLETGPVLDKTKADAVLLSVIVKFKEPVDLTQPREDVPVK